MRRILRAALITIVLFFQHKTSSTAVEPLHLSTPITEGAQLRLNWTGGAGPFQLQDAAAPNGPWLNVGAALDATSTTVALTAPQRYFRVSGALTDTNSGAAALNATILAVQTFLDTIPTTDRQAWRTQIINFLNSRADIASAGESADGVWAITSDGVPIALWNNRLPDPFDPEDILPQAAALRTQTPGNAAARFSTTVGAGFRLAGPRLARQLGSHGYAPTFDDAQLTSLQGQRNESVFFFNTHGGSFEIPLFAANGQMLRENGVVVTERAYGLWSGTKWDANSPDYGVYLYEMKEKRLALSISAASFTTNALGESVAVNECHYAITAQWVRDYMTYPPENHASVWLGACLSGSADAADMRNAFRSAGAEMVSGWTQNVTGAAVVTATSFLYDRLLGANEVQPPATPQRPFNYADSWTELRSRGLHLHPSVDNNTNLINTEIIYEGASGDEAFGVFAPSIAYVLIDEIGDRVVLNGIFGTPPANSRQVNIDGVDTTVLTWEPRKIVCSLPRTGVGSAGEVQVLVHGFKSNIRRITRWTVNGAYKMIEADTPHVVDGTLKMIFRADVGEYRKVPGNVFIRPTRYAVAAQNSEIRLTASGTLSAPCGDGGGSDAYTWLGSALFPTYDPVGNYLVHAVVSLDTIDQTGALGLAFGMRDPDQFPLKMHVVTCEGATFTFPLGLAPSGPVNVDPLLFGSPIEELLPDGSKYEYPLPGGVFAFGADWSIAAGRADSEIDSGMQWNRADPEFPPDPAAAR
jgi:hypothetical protein